MARDRAQRRRQHFFERRPRRAPFNLRSQLRPAVDAAASARRHKRHKAAAPSIRELTNGRRRRILARPRHQKSRLHMRQHRHHVVNKYSIEPRLFGFRTAATIVPFRLQTTQHYRRLMGVVATNIRRRRASIGRQAFECARAVATICTAIQREL